MARLSIVLLAFALGCEGRISEPPPLAERPDVVTPEQCVGIIDAPETGWGLLDPIEYEHAVSTILEQDVQVADQLDAEQGSHITLLGAERLNEVAAALVLDHPLGNCTDDTCAEAFLQGAAQRAFRRSLDPEEQAFVSGRFADARSAGADVRRATAMVVEVLLQAPQTLYTPVFGAPRADGLIQLSGDEMATRMALFLWSGVPDEALRSAAAAGELDTSEGVAAQAARMLDHPRAEVALGRFAVDWLGLEGGATRDPLATADKDPARFPEMSDTMRAAMRREVIKLVGRALEGDDGVSTLFTSRDAYVDTDLATLYGVDAPEGGEGWVELPEGERAGLLTRAAFLANYAGASVRSPIRRGVFVLEEVLCRPLGEPPPNANDVRVEGGASDDGVRSVREDVIARTQGSGCIECHSAINPAGFLFDRYDAIGRFQLEEVVDVDGDAHTFTLDPSGDLLGTPFGDALELSTHLAQSPVVRECLAERLFEQAVGRHVAAEDACSIAEVRAQLVEHGDLRQALVALVTHESFRFVRPSSATSGEER